MVVNQNITIRKLYYMAKYKFGRIEGKKKMNQVELYDLNSEFEFGTNKVVHSAIVSWIKLIVHVMLVKNTFRMTTFILHVDHSHSHFAGMRWACKKKTPHTHEMNTIYFPPSLLNPNFIFIDFLLNFSNWN